MKLNYIAVYFYIAQAGGPTRNAWQMRDLIVFIDTVYVCYRCSTYLLHFNLC